MKKVLLALMVLMVFMLVGCDATVTTQEVDIVEVPIIIKETEVVTIEVPVIVKEIEIVTIETQAIIYEDKMTKAVFFTADTDLAIVTIGKGSVTYIMEIEYKDTLLDPPMMYMIQIEKQIDGETEDWFFFKDYSGVTADFVDGISFEVEDYDDFMLQVKYILDETDDYIWQMFEEIYTVLYEDYYSGE